MHILFVAQVRLDEPSGRARHVLLEAVHLIEECKAAAVNRGLRTALEAETRRGSLPPQAVELARSTLGWEHPARRIIELPQRCA